MPARRRDYQAEYQRRIAKHPNVPRAVQRGHGPVPAHIAAKAERKELTRGEARKYGRGLIQYQVRFDREEIAKGSRSRDATRPPHRIPETFRTKREAEGAAQLLPIPRHYLRFVKEGGTWYVFAAEGKVKSRRR